jgi:hypothetical protein
MAIDFEKLKNKLAELKNPSSKQFKSFIWKTPQKDGEEKSVRLVQYPQGDDPFVELWFHYRIGNKSILCPRKNDGKPCPICELCHSLYESNDEKELALAKSLLPTQRIYAVMLDRGDPEATPMYWGFGVTVYQKLIELLVNPRTRNMMDVENGFDLKVFSHKNPTRKYRETDFSPEGEDTPLFAKKEDTQKFLAAIKPLREVFKPMTNSEIKGALDAWLNGGDTDPEKASTETAKGPAAEADPLADDVKNAAPVDTVADIEESFNTAVKKQSRK